MVKDTDIKNKIQTGYFNLYFSQPKSRKKIFSLQRYTETFLGKVNTPKML